MVGPVCRPTAGTGQRGEGLGARGHPALPSAPGLFHADGGASSRAVRRTQFPLRIPRASAGSAVGGRALAGPESPAPGGGGRGRAPGEGGCRGLGACAAERRNSAPAKPRKRASPWCDLWRARRSQPREVGGKQGRGWAVPEGLRGCERGSEL